MGHGNSTPSFSSGSPDGDWDSLNCVAFRKLLLTSRWLAFHHHSQNAVDSRLVATAMTLEPIEHIGVEADRQLLIAGTRAPSSRERPRFNY